MLSGFFVDVNLYKESKQRAADIGKIMIDANKDKDNASGADSLADEDANLMVKLKFLTYKVNRRLNWLPVFISFACVCT